MATDGNGMTALHWAFYRVDDPNIDTVKYLVQHGGMEQSSNMTTMEGLPWIMRKKREMIPFTTFCFTLVDHSKTKRSMAD